MGHPPPKRRGYWNPEMRILELMFERMRFAKAVKRGQGLHFEGSDWLTGSAEEYANRYLFIMQN